VAHGKPVLREKYLDIARQAEQPEHVGDGCSVLPGPLRNLLMAQLVFARKSIECLRDLDGIQVLTLDVLNEGDLHEAVIGIVLDDNRDQR
jgi:hypothetical protein